MEKTVEILDEGTVEAVAETTNEVTETLNSGKGVINPMALAGIGALGLVAVGVIAFKKFVYDPNKEKINAKFSKNKQKEIKVKATPIEPKEEIVEESEEK